MMGTLDWLAAHPWTDVPITLLMVVLVLYLLNRYPHR
jgi:hypothetical protein